MSRYRPFRPIKAVPCQQYDDPDAARRRDERHIQLVLSQGGFERRERIDGVTVASWPDVRRVAS